MLFCALPLLKTIKLCLITSDTVVYVLLTRNVEPKGFCMISSLLNFSFSFLPYHIVTFSPPKMLQASSSNFISVASCCTKATNGLPTHFHPSQPSSYQDFTLEVERSSAKLCVSFSLCRVHCDKLSLQSF